MIATPAALITKAASSQTYYTIRFLVDRERVDDAYRAYGYFRWVDDTLDTAAGSDIERKTFLGRQKSLLEDCYAGRPPRAASPQETMLVELVQQDREKNSGLRLYLGNMMRVMDFDVRRRGRLISQVELNKYTGWLASAVTECIHYFVGHGGYTPQDATRYLAVSGAHIAHMLRDTFEDAQLGYYNIPREVLEAGHIGPTDTHSDAYRLWVNSRVSLARGYFKAGKAYFARVETARCRLACFAYIARFEWLLDTWEREGYRLRAEYPERNSARTGFRMIAQTLSCMLTGRDADTPTARIASERQGKA